MMERNMCMKFADDGLLSVVQESLNQFHSTRAHRLTHLGLMQVVSEFAPMRLPRCRASYDMYTRPVYSCPLAVFGNCSFRSGRVSNETATE